MNQSRKIEVWDPHKKCEKIFSFLPYLISTKPRLGLAKAREKVQKGRRFSGSFLAILEESLQLSLYTLQRMISVAEKKNITALWLLQIDQNLLNILHIFYIQFQFIIAFFLSFLSSFFMTLHSYILHCSSIVHGIHCKHVQLNLQLLE